MFDSMAVEFVEEDGNGLKLNMGMEDRTSTAHTRSAGMTFCRIAIVDNDEMALRSLIRIIHERIRFASPIWTAATARQALEHCSAPRDIPDVLLVDMSLEGIQGPSLCRHIRLGNTKTRLLAITSFSTTMYHDKAVHAGVQGLISKNDEDEIVRGIHLMQCGEVMEGFESPVMAQIRLKHEPAPAILSIREEEILDLVATCGLVDRQIADRLGIAEATVRRHMHNIMKKLGARTSRQAVAIWLNNR
ncbi:response regulator transcription factor [Bifidobacterium eulemuris]|uniref:Response regulator transcription factor n=3 Tax=Bifidobacterium eulemuris TaxID=1765219 RepID=A0A7L9SNY0_9BIFI|nr:response regulator transcription factor [Bifidobacterium eulemuris]QOL31566.1 response regulator transcription factor [Bifidobacterium eulemuris]